MIIKEIKPIIPNECIVKNIEFEEIKKLLKWIRPR